MDLSVTTTSFGVEDQTWLGSAHGTSMGRTVTLDASKFTAGTHYPTGGGALPSGTALGIVTASGKFGPYDDAASDGRQTLVGYTLTNTQIKTSTSFPQAALYEHGRVIVANLPFATGAGAVDAAGKVDSAGRIIHV